MFTSTETTLIEGPSDTPIETTETSPSQPTLPLCTPGIVYLGAPAPNTGEGTETSSDTEGNTGGGTGGATDGSTGGEQTSGGVGSEAGGTASDGEESSGGGVGGSSGSTSNDSGVSGDGSYGGGETSTSASDGGYVGTTSTPQTPMPTYPLPDDWESYSIEGSYSGTGIPFTIIAQKITRTVSCECPQATLETMASVGSYGGNTGSSGGEQTAGGISSEGGVLGDSGYYSNSGYYSDTGYLANLLRGWDGRYNVRMPNGLVVREPTTISIEPYCVDYLFENDPSWPESYLNGAAEGGGTSYENSDSGTGSYNGGNNSGGSSGGTAGSNSSGGVGGSAGGTSSDHTPSGSSASSGTSSH